MSRILVVDDEEPARFALRFVLEDAGYQVDEAVNGAIAEKMIAQTAYDAVITDILMPGQDGIETILHLKRSHPKLPVIAVSGGGRTNSQEYLHLAAGFDVFATLSKPILPGDLLPVLERACAQ